MSKQRFLCAVCRSKLPPLPQRHLGLAMHLKLLMTTGFLVMSVGLMMGTWAGVKASLFHLPLVLIAEWFQWLKVRSALRCKTCDFDPMLYRSNWRMARKQVERKLRHHSEELQQHIRAEISRLDAQKSGVSGAVASMDSKSNEEATAETADTETSNRDAELETPSATVDNSPYQKANKTELSP